MTLGRAASLFETYITILHLALQRLQQLQRSMHFCVVIAKEKTTNCRIVPRKSHKKRAEKPYASSSEQSRSAKRQRYPCAICDSMDHLSHLCPRREEVKLCLAQSSGRPTPTSNSLNRKPAVGWGSTWVMTRVLSDGLVRDEVTQLRSLRKPRFCL